MKTTKRFLLLLLSFVLTLTYLQSPVWAQRGPRPEQGRQAGDNGGASQAGDEDDPCVDPEDNRYCWTQDPITGIQYRQVPDSSHVNLADRQTMAGMSMGLVHTGNLFAPHQIADLFDRRPQHDFLFINAYSLFAYRPEDMLLYNTRIPFTNVSYLTSGSSRESNDRLRINFAGNINSQLGIGTFLDYVYARGEYISEATKPLKWTSYVYYNSDRYNATLSLNLSKLANQENGGITDRRFVLTPDIFESQHGLEPRTMRTNLDKAWNDMNTLNVHFNHNYNLGFWHERVNPSDSTDVWDEFTNVASIYHSFDYESMDHTYLHENSGTMRDSVYFYPHDPKEAYIDSSNTRDTTAYHSLTTCAGIRINEGFSSWSQFGLSAFIGYQHQEYRQMVDTLKLSYIQRTHATDNLFIGGQLSRHQSQRLYFDVNARLWLMGDKQDDYDITAHLQTVIPAGQQDSITVSASGYLRRQSPSFMMRRFFSNHFRWQHDDFDPEQRLHLDGAFRYSLTGTELHVGFDRIADYHYFRASDGCPYQHGSKIEILSAKLTQRLHWRAIHFDNTLLLQQISDEDSRVMPLPRFVWQSDLSLRFVIAHTLTTQMGCTAHLTDSYYTPVYQPATQQFCIQDADDAHRIKCGGYPLFNAYVNCNLKRIKFYVMYSGFTANFRGKLRDIFTNDRFHMPYNPLQSTRVEYGVVFDLQD